MEEKEDVEEIEEEEEWEAKRKVLKMQQEAWFRPLRFSGFRFFMGPSDQIFGSPRRAHEQSRTAIERELTHQKYGHRPWGVLEGGRNRPLRFSRVGSQLISSGQVFVSSQ